MWHTSYLIKILTVLLHNYYIFWRIENHQYNLNETVRICGSCNCCDQLIIVELLFRCRRNYRNSQCTWDCTEVSLKTLLSYPTINLNTYVFCLFFKVQR